MAHARLFAVLLLALGSCHCADYGARLRVTAAALEYVDKVAIPQLSQLMLDAKIKDVSGSAGTPLGRIDYEFKEIKITSASIRNSSFKPAPGVGLQIAVSGMFVAATGHWHYRKKHWPHISDSGSVDVSAQDVSFELAVMLGADLDTGRPTMTTDKCSSNIDRVNVRFHGGASWLYNLFSREIGKTIRRELQDAICKCADKYISGHLATELGKIKVDHKLDKWAKLNYELTEQPDSTNDYIDVFVKGEIDPLDHAYTPKFQPSPLPRSPASSKMAYFWISDYLAKTAADVYTKAGFLVGTLYPNMIPKDVPFQLNTKAFKIFLPKLYQLYPDEPMMVKVHIDQPPEVSIKTSGINGSAVVIIDVYVTPKNKQPVMVFSLDTLLKVGLTLHLKYNFLVGEGKFLSLTVLKVKSNIGDIKTSEEFFKRGIEVFGKRVLVKQMNELVSKGVPLPKVENVEFVNTELSLGKNFVLLATDLRYVPDLERVHQAEMYAAYKEKLLAMHQQ